MLDASATVEPVAIADTVEQLVSALTREHPDATIRTATDPITVQTNPALFSRVLEEVLENAVLHGGSAPTITVEVARAGGEVRVAVADDGPGIPQEEIEPVVSGEETALDHASSLGLWPIYWGTRALSGTVQFTTTEDGSEVTLVIPD
jgi:K+-sensing histidine kinase KdpD